MRRDADITVQRVSRAIEKVLQSDGWISGTKVWDRRHLKKIAEAMARHASEPSKYTNQGFHHTSLTQCLLRQELETNPAYVMELVSSVAATGKAFVGTGPRGRLVQIENSSLALDLEARMATDELVAESGIRDAMGQLFDLLIVQAYWDEHPEPETRYTYTQDQKPKPGTTGERLYKVDVATLSQFENLYEGPRLTVADAFEIGKLFDEKGRPIVVHESLAGDLKEFFVRNEKELWDTVQDYKQETGKPTILLVFAGLLPGSVGLSRGHDLHAVTVFSYGDGDSFTMETRWGPKSDIHVIELTGAQLIEAMTLPSVSVSQPYDDEPPHLRVIDPAYPIAKSDRAPQFQQMQNESERLQAVEKSAHANPAMKEQTKYFEELEKWEAKRAEHDAVFGDDLPFKIPPPTPPSTTGSF